MPSRQYFVGTELIDLDGDGDLDAGGLYFTSNTNRLYGMWIRNRFRHLSGPRTVALGKTLEVGMIGPDQHTFHLGVSPNEVRYELGSSGTLRIDPTQMIVLPGKLLQNRVRGVWSFPVPNDTNLVGLQLRFQALDAGSATVPAHLTGLLRTKVVK